ncbi:MAG: orotate phosphoribosyltransferase [Thermoplasmata archaeon]|nr:orotate phosphoribosyltransferase [Thermoplasmata archaeon]
MVAPEVGGSGDERAEVARLLLASGAVKFGTFTLTSGRTSTFYIDVKQVWTDPGRLRVIARAFARRIRPGERLAGMELGAVPLVVATALEIGRPIVVLRKQPKDHGTQQLFEGEVPAGSTFVLLEDVTTTGGSVLRSVEILRAAGATVDRALVVVDREEGAGPTLATAGVILEPLVTLEELRHATP